MVAYLWFIIYHEGLDEIQLAKRREMTLMRSTIVFIARLTPAEACSQLDLSYSQGEVKLSVQGHKIVYAITRGWDYSNTRWFDELISGVREFLLRCVDALAIEGDKSLAVEITDWVELGQTDKQQETQEGKFVVGKVQHPQYLAEPVSVTELDAAFNYEPLMAQNPFLRLAIGDYHRALNSQEDSLIYLARAVETVKRHFGSQQAMQQAFGCSKNFIEYVTKRANKYEHMRHASRTGAVTRPPHDEKRKCFIRTREIISKFRDHLSGFTNS